MSPVEDTVSLPLGRVLRGTVDITPVEVIHFQDTGVLMPLTREKLTNLEWALKSAMMLAAPRATEKHSM